MQVIAANLQTSGGKQIRSLKQQRAQANGRLGKGVVKPKQVAANNEKIALVKEMKERSLPEFEEFFGGTMRQFTGEKSQLKE